MTREEFEAKRKELSKKFDKDLRELEMTYLMSNSPYKVGDIVEDHCDRGRIKEIRLTHGYHNEPELVFRCDKLTKKGEINKMQPTTTIYACNIKK